MVDTLINCGNGRAANTAVPATPGSVIARFLELRGRRVIEATGCCWVNVRNGSRYFESIPNHLLLEPEPGEVEQVLRRGGGLLARYPSRGSGGLVGGRYVCRDPNFDLSSLGKQRRKDVRRGLRNCEIRLVTLEELLGQGLTLNRDTMARQHRFDPEYGDVRHWETFVEAVVCSPAVVVIGAFIGRRLASYVTLVQDGDAIHLLDRMTRTKDLKMFPGEALLFTVMREALRRPEIRLVSGGPVPLLGMDGLHRYKLRSGYEVAPCRVMFRLHPALTALRLGALGRLAVGVLGRMLPGNPVLARTRLVLGSAASSGRGRRGEEQIRQTGKRGLLEKRLEALKQ